MRKLKLDELGRLDPEAFKKQPGFPVAVVLDNIRSAYNVGSIFRTCDGFACEHLYLTGITAQPPHKEINKSAIGATLSVKWKYFEHVYDCIETLKEEGYLIIGIEQTTESIPLQDFPFAKINLNPCALVFGNEVDGLTDSILPLLDFAVEVPQYGTKHSFNVAVCAGIVIWEFVKNYLP